MAPLDGPLGVNDWITAPAASAPQASGPLGVSDWITAPAEAARPQSLAGAGVNALAQGAVSGTGSLIAGIGRQPVAAAREGVQRQLAVMDAIDRGDDVPQDHDTIGYQSMSPEMRAEARSDFTKADNEIAARQPNAMVNAGVAMEGAARSLFPVEPAQEGHVTNVARSVGNMAPALLAGAAGSAVGGPVGAVLASAAVIGSQSYDGTYQAEIAKGRTPDQADAAADQDALINMASSSLPISRVIPMIPVSLREGFLKTIANVGVNYLQKGGEMAAGNSLASIAQNYVASQTYDPGRPVFKTSGDDVLDSFLSGLVVHGAAEGAVGAARAAVASDIPTMRVRPEATIADIGAAPDIDSAIAAAAKAAASPASGAAASGAGSPGAPLPSLGDIFNTAGAGDTAQPSQVMTLPSGLKAPFSWKVAEGRDLTPATGDLQPRDREGRVSSTEQIIDLANRLDPDQLHASVGPDQGAPTVNADGVVLAGNGRTAAIRQAFTLGNANADAYRAMVERYGFDTRGMSEPVLYRSVDVAPEQQRQIAVQGNIPTVQRMSGTEQAAIDAHSLTPDLLALYNPSLTGGLTAAGNRDFVRQWVATVPQSERNAVWTEDGGISADGVRRLQGALLSVAYADRGTLARSLESTDDTTKALTGALTDAAPSWAQLQGGIVSGRIPADMNVAPQLTRAVDLVRQAREKGQTVSDVLGQSDAFNPLDPVTAAFVKVFYNADLTRASSRSFVAEVLRRYAAEAGKTSTDAGLFGDAEPALAPADILATVTGAVRAERGTSEATPEAVGAAATPDAQRNMTMRDMKANRRVAEYADLLAPAEMGDNAIHVEGSFPTLAERSGDAVTSQHEGLLRERNPDAFYGKDGRLTLNNQARVNAFEAHTVPDTVVNTMDDNRAARWNAASAAILPTAKPANLTAAYDWVAGLLRDPRVQENDAIRATLEGFRNRLVDPETGKLKTDPAAVWGMHDNLQNQLAKAKDPMQASGVERLSVKQINTAKKLIDQAMNVATNGRFQAALDQYAEDSKEINSARLVNDYRLKLTNMHGELQAERFHKFVVGLAKERGDPGIDPSMDISDETMRAFIAIDKDLKRAGLIKLGAARGSPTNLLGALAQRAGLNVAHKIAAKIPGAGGMIEAGLDYRADRKMASDTKRHLAPPEGGYTNPNAY